MAPRNLEGDTLGTKHKSLNILVKKKVSEGPAKLEKVNPNGSDVDNLLTIEIASKTKNLEVILDVLKSEDMLYVSRAIKHSTWLVTDPQYAHIINPEYLHSQLFQHMTVRACNKLLLHIRLNTKDEARVDDFYHYFKKKDQKAALKWLPHCSLDVIKKAVEDQYSNIEVHLLKRLCKKSFTVLETYLRKCQDYNPSTLKSVMFLLNAHTEKYLDLVEKKYFYYETFFGRRATGVIMKKSPQRILDNFEDYCYIIHLPTFAKHLKIQDVKGFLLKYAEKDSMQYWFNCYNLKHFIRCIPREGRFDSFKTIYEKSHLKGRTDTVTLNCESDEVILSSICDSETRNLNASSSIEYKYRLYKFASFQTAFPDLKKLICSEPSPPERYKMLKVLFSCAKRNHNNISKLLKYFHDKHINEPFKFKHKFVNLVITQTNTWIYDEKAWNNLNNIFHSMEVYTESENNVQSCIHCIIVKKKLHDEKVPDIIEKKFTFDTLKNVQKNLSPAETDKIFIYLSNILLMKIRNVVVQNEAEFAEVVQLLERLLILISDYNKELADFPDVVAKIKELARIKAKEPWETDMLCLYNKRKSWRRHMFEVSLLMCPSESACLNALKHEPDLLLRHECAVAALRRDDAVSLRRVLVKLRVYWHDSLAAEWANEYLSQLDGQSGHKATVRGLCVLLPHKQLLNVIKKYEPNTNKIQWSNDDEILLSLRKQIAKNMYIANPSLSPDAVLTFARGDYLQFALPSLNAILHNISPKKCREYIPKLLEAPVSLQKHGIRFALTKLESTELQTIFSDVWKSSKNVSIRAVVFKQTYKLLCNENDLSRTEEIWKLLETFIENLSQEENRITYDLLAKLNKVPLQVRGKYCMKVYAYLKSLSPNANYESLVEKVLICTRDIMESLEVNFVINILQESLDIKFTENYDYEYLNVMSAFLLCSKDAESQILRYEKLLAPLLDSCLGQWERRVDGKYVVRNNVTNLLKQLSRDIPHFVLDKKMTYPVQLFASILGKLEAKIPMKSNYVFVKSWEMTVHLVKILEDQNSLLSAAESQPTCKGNCDSDSDERWGGIYLKATPAFAAYIIKLLKKEIIQCFPLVYDLIGKAVGNMVQNMELKLNFLLEVLINMLDNKDSVECCLLVIGALPSELYLYNDEALQNLKKIQHIFRVHQSDEVKMHYYSICIDDF